MDLATGGRRIDGPISWRFTNAAPLAGVWFTHTPPLSGAGSRDTAAARARTADYPLPGAPQLGGAEDGRTRFFYNGYVEGMTGPARGDQGVKLPAADLRYLYFTCPIPISRIALPKGAVPRQVPVGVYQIGAATNVAIATLPGEFTMMMGRRIATAVSNSLPERPAQVLLAGLANEYVSYFTTPEEYAAQHYEGASTLYGPQSGPLVGKHLADLAGQFRQPGGTNGDRVFEYKPGGTRAFGVHDLTSGTGREPDDALQVVLQGQEAKCHDWEDVLPRLNAGATNAVLPRLSIEQQAADGAWGPLLLGGLPESNEGLDFVTFITAVGRADVCWRAAWMPPATVDRSGALRFKIEKLNGQTTNSAPFVLGP
jgi:neutral ceramidase